MTAPKPVDPVDWGEGWRCEMCGGVMEHLTGPATWQDTTKCDACGWSPDDAWRVGER